MCTQGHHGAQFEHMHHIPAPHGVMQETFQQVQWARREGNQETTASAENVDIQHEEELKSLGQPTRTAEVTSRWVMTTSCDYVVVGGPKQYEQPAGGTPVLTPSVSGDL
jgi:hypothetical protein